jgi:hypothetical protein
MSSPYYPGAYSKQDPGAGWGESEPSVTVPEARRDGVIPAALNCITGRYPGGLGCEMLGRWLLLDFLLCERG